MSDILTQIQDELDMLLHIMSSSLAHIRLHAPPSVPPGQVRVDTFAEIAAKTSADNTQTTQPTQQTQLTASSDPSTNAISTPEKFEADIKELARDTVLKEQQIELLIANLPGLRSSEKEQVERMRGLEKELRELEGERSEAVREKERLVALVEERIGGVGRGW